METKEILKNQFHLDKKEVSIYLATLELGEASARDIAQKAGIQRTYFYDLSSDLIRSGLLRRTKKGKKTLFLAIAPDELLKIQGDRLRQLHEVLPELKALQSTKGRGARVFYYEGMGGIKQILQDTLNYKGEILNFTTPRFVTAEQRRFSREYIKKRVVIGNSVRVVGEVSPELIELKKRDADELRETRMLPRGIFSSEIEIGIYGNRVYITDYKEEFGLVIEGSEVAKTMRMIFEIIWQSGRIVE